MTGTTRFRLAFAASSRGPNRSRLGRGRRGPSRLSGGKTVVKVYEDDGVEAAEAFVRKVIGKFE
jgi:hypothetical protein